MFCVRKWNAAKGLRLRFVDRPFPPVYHGGLVGLFFIAIYANGPPSALKASSVIGLIVLGLAFLFFLVIVFFAAKSLQIGHAVALAFLFLFTLLFLYMSAALMRTHDKYRPMYTKTMKDIETQEKRARELTVGTSNEPAGEGTLVGERTLARVSAATSGKTWGNVRVARPGIPIVLDMSRWMSDGCQRVGQEDSDAPVEPVPDDEFADVDADTSADPDASADGATPDAGPVVEAGTHGIVAGQFVYAFKEFPIAQMTAAEKEYYFAGLGEGEDAFPNLDTRGLCRVPIAYLGKFLVQQVDANTVTVVPTKNLTRGQQQQLGNPAPIVLYEKLPLDSHDVFDSVEAGNLSKLIPIQRLIAGGLQVTPAAYERMIREFSQDGQEYTGRVENPMRVMVQVKFLQDYEQVVDLEVEGDLPPADSPFDVQGRAQVPSLLQGEPTKFEKDQLATFDARTADNLVRQGVAERVGNPVYSRQLRDFEFSLERYNSVLEEAAAERQLLQGQVDALTKSLERLQEQIDKHRRELARLQEDQSGFDSEKQELSGYRSVLEERLEVLKNEVDTLITVGG